MSSVDAIIYALLGGILPALVWLAFWLHEDYKHPEPRGLILKTFLLGMGSVVLVLPFQKVVASYLPGLGFMTILLWVVIEEVFKFIAAYSGGLGSREDNEPIDPIIYMITAALGFVALENALFILSPIIEDELMKSIITGNLRFIGASLVHVVSSGLVGVALAFSFYQPIQKKITFTLIALGLALFVHTGFNLAIMHGGNSGAMFAFASVWTIVIALLLAFERAKAIAR